MAVQVYNGVVNGGATVSGLAQGLPAESKALAVSILVSYAATTGDGATGVTLYVGSSLDGGVTYSDYAALGTASPPAGSDSPVQSQAYFALDDYKGATHLQFELVNQDGPNDATVTLTFRAAA
jgi:hypothetical protein